MNPAAGPDTGDVLISPQPGMYPPLRPYKPGTPAIPGTPGTPEEPGDKFVITFTTTQTHGYVFYRLAAGAAWQRYNPSTPPPLTAAATVEAYAQHGANRTPTRSATYSFGTPNSLAVATNLDSNGNGLPDQWEKAFNITDPNGDADGDGSSNLTEFTRGTDPRDPNSGAAVVPPVLTWSVTDAAGGGTSLRLEWEPANSTAVLEASDDLRTWTPVASDIGSDSTGRFYDVPLDPPATPRRFYRLGQP